MIGRYPTPIERFAGLSTPRTTLWVKRDDLTAPRYGGNKVRKLDFLLPEAERRGVRRIVTIGAAGSHHVLATTLYARERGIDVVGLMTSQPRSPHAVEMLRASLGAGLDARAAPRMSDVLRLLPSVRRKGDWVVPPGGSNPVGTVGYLEAAIELAEQIDRGEAEAPDVVVVALGSGGTAAGIVAGLAAAGLAAKVVAVRIVPPSLAGAGRTLALAKAALARSVLRASTAALFRGLEVDGGWLGRGYGHPTDEGEAASARAADHGLGLDPTYTAKTFAAALARVESGAARHVLYWHTLSSAPMAPLLASAPAEADLAPELAALFR